MTRRSLQCLVSTIFLCFTAGALALRAQGPDDGPKIPPKSPQAWTLEEARAQVQLNPDDAYLQYVALQLARNEQQTAQVAQEIEQLHWRNRWGGRPAERRVDLFDLFSGALAVQESLQLDTMRQPAGTPGAAANPRRNTVNLADLAGPTVKSHPWGKMLAAQTLAGKQPEVSPLSLCVPEDQYFVEFHSLGKLLEASEVGDLWGDHIFTQAAKSAQSQRAGERVKAQLAIQTDPLSRPFYDMVVDEVALTGSDLYFREGTDVTLLFAVKQPEVFKPRMDGFLEAAAKSRPDAVRSTGKILGVDYVAVATPDRAISAFSAYPRPNLHVRSNSKAALARVLAAIDGGPGVPNAPGVARLGDATEFKYIRTLMPRDKREDGFIYLSDPFIRRLVGPQVKLTESRRLVCYNHLRMIGHAALLYRTQFGRQAKSLGELVAARCAPEFFTDVQAGRGQESLVCPCGGKYTLSDDGTTGVCSHHGHARQLVPGLEIPLDQVTEAEAAQYRQFVEAYNQYWRRYFDPIAIRIQLAPKQYRVETIILPLIDNSIYTGLAEALGGEPEPLDALPVPPRNIFSVAVRLNKERLLKQLHGGPGVNFDLSPQWPSPAQAEEFLAKGIGNQVGMHVYDSVPTFDFNLTSFMGEMMGRFHGTPSGLPDEMAIVTFLVASLNSPVYVSVPVQDAKVVDKFLDQLDAGVARLARQPERGGWFPLDHDFYKVPLAGSDTRIRCYGISLGPVKWRLFYARLDNVLYIASKQCILDDLAAGKGKLPSPPAPLPPAEYGRMGEGRLGPAAHAMIRVRPEHWKAVLPEYRLGWEECSRQACLDNLGPLSSVGRAMAATRSTGYPGATRSGDVQRQADRLFGVHFYCPDGGTYELSADGKRVTCSVHGSADAPRQLAAPAAGSPTGRLMREFGGATAALTFLEDGLHAMVTIQRK